MINDVIFSIAQTQDIERVYRFHYRYTQELRSLYVWNWEYGQINPNKSLLIIGRLGDEIVATQGVMCVNLVVDDEVRISGKNESLLIERDLRRKGLSSSLYNYAMDEYKKLNLCCIWGFSRKALPSLKKAGFQVFPKPVNRAILSLTYCKTRELLKTKKNWFLKDSLLHVGVFLATVYSSTMFKLTCRKPIKASYNVRDSMLSENDISDFFSKIRRLYPQLIYIEQNATHYEWRIRKSPLPINSVFVYDNEVLVGFMHVCIKTTGLDLMDFVFNSNDVGRVLLNNLKEFMHSIDAGCLVYFGNKHNALNIKIFRFLSRHGFITLPGPNDFVLRLFDPSMTQENCSIDNWYMNGLWYEGI